MGLIGSRVWNRFHDRSVDGRTAGQGFTGASFLFGCRTCADELRARRDPAARERSLRKYGSAHAIAPRISRSLLIWAAARLIATILASQFASVMGFSIMTSLFRALLREAYFGYDSAATGWLLIYVGFLGVVMQDGVYAASCCAAPLKNSSLSSAQGILCHQACSSSPSRLAQPRTSSCSPALLAFPSAIAL